MKKTTSLRKLLSRNFSAVKNVNLISGTDGDRPTWLTPQRSQRIRKNLKYKSLNKYSAFSGSLR